MQVKCYYLIVQFYSRLPNFTSGFYNYPCIEYDIALRQLAVKKPTEHSFFSRPSSAAGRSGERWTTFFGRACFRPLHFIFYLFIYFYLFQPFLLCLHCLWNCLIALSKVLHLMSVLLMHLSITLVARFTCKPVQGVKTKQSHVVPNTAIIIMPPVWFNSLSLND